MITLDDTMNPLSLELDNKYYMSRKLNASAIWLSTIDDQTREVIMDHMINPISNETKTLYKEELNLLDDLRNQVASEQTAFLSNRTARNELSMRNKKFEHTHYSLENDIHNNTIPFFPWNDGIDYNKVCSRILALLSRRGPVIINNSHFGGLGHKFLSIFFSISYALLTKRPLYRMHYFDEVILLVDLRDVIWDNMNSCFRSLSFHGSGVL